ncbi:iron ABC transporter permease [Alteribacillus sp. YIM 98480]|uniref:FecCD family ABC transporter permease n=1 Tax=Alteribacillus sp. YIM 98480 TaxID=2606599 RepID=UPI00131A834F|nr:iron ABC transporter permease [Alteribacillus sp. YIM 98480]
MSKNKVFRTKNDRFSFMFDQKSIFNIVFMTCVLLVLFLVSASIGESFIHPLQVMKTLFGHGEPGDQLIIETLRMPRLLVALFAGAGLAISGAILQGMIKNPLASPDIIGITGGAGVTVVLFLALFSNDNHSLIVSVQWMPLAAFLGAVALGFIVYFLSYKNGISPIRLILIGIGLSTLTQALTTMFMMLGPIHRAAQANLWLTGSVNGASWTDVQLIAPVIILLFLLTLVSFRKVNAQTLGGELALSIGAHLQRDRILMLILCTGLAGTTVAFAGGIGFVGLMAPHMARRLVGSSYGALIPLSALIGAILVMGADLLGRTAFSPHEVPAGVFTATIGAPYFIYLLYKSKNRS